MQPRAASTSFSKHGSNGRELQVDRVVRVAVEIFYCPT
jgi:hypothetical protein